MRLQLVIVLAALVFPVSAVSQTRPTLRVVGNLPLALRGTHFRPGENVRVTVVMGERTRARQLRVGALGGFTVRFAGVRLDYCALPLVIRARGASSGLVR